jgi:signal peptidase II
MLSPNRRLTIVKLLSFVGMSALGGGCDLRSKAWAEATLSELPGHTMRIVEPWLDFTLSYNRGTAFSFIGDLGGARAIIGAFSLVVVLFLLFLALRKESGRFEALAFGVIAAGALGNAFDRMFREAPGGGTGVVDFIRVSYPWGGAWPTFNVADAFVAIGVGLLLVHSLRSRRHEPDSTPSEAPAAVD